MTLTHIYHRNQPAPTMPPSRTFDTTPPGKDYGEMKIFPRSQESERRMLVNAITQATKLVNRHATKKNTNGKTPLEESQEKLASTKRASKRLGDIRRMGQTIFSPHIMQTKANTKYSAIFLATYWSDGQSQPLYNSGTPQQSNKNKEKESTQTTITEDDETNDSLNQEPDHLDESVTEESMASYDFDEDESMTRQQELFTSYEEQQTDAISQIMTNFQDAEDVEDPSETSTKEEALTKEDITDEDQPKDASLWQIADQDELLRILSARIDALYKPTITNLETRVTREQEQRAAMEDTLNTI